MYSSTASHPRPNRRTDMSICRRVSTSDTRFLLDHQQWDFPHPVLQGSSTCVRLSTVAISSGTHRFVENSNRNRDTEHGVMNLIRILVWLGVQMPAEADRNLGNGPTSPSHSLLLATCRFRAVK